MLLALVVRKNEEKQSRLDCKLGKISQECASVSGLFSLPSSQMRCHCRDIFLKRCEENSIDTADEICLPNNDLRSEQVDISHKKHTKTFKNSGNGHFLVALTVQALTNSSVPGLEQYRTAI